MTSTTRNADARQLTAPTSRDEVSRLVTALFSGGPRTVREGVSPAGAFQSALYGRSTLIDLRSQAERQHTGDLDPHLFGDAIVTADLPDPVAAAYQVSLTRPGLPAHVLVSDDEHARQIVGQLRGLGVVAHHVEGGFSAWQASGLPVLRVA